MAQVIKLKRRATGGLTGAPSGLAVGEPAYSEVDSILYIGITGGTVQALGGIGAFCTLTGPQTITGAKTFTTGTTTFSAAVALGSSATATTPATGSNDTTVATTAYVKLQPGINATGTVTSVALSLPAIFTVSGSPVTTTGTLTAALASQTAATVFAAPSGATGAPSFRALVEADIPSLTYTKITNFDTQVRTNRLDQMAVPSASVSMNAQKITNLATPTADTDAATKAYVDASRAGLDVKQSCRLATIANIVNFNAAPNQADGVTVVAGDRILVRSQTGLSQNGIYVVTTVGTGANGVWTRASDANSADEVTAGMFTFVTEGGTLQDTGWVLTANDPITLDSTALEFAQFSGGGVPATYVGQSTITTLGTIAQGTWNATTISVSKGGTGATTLTGILKGNGTSAFTAAVLDTDYLNPSSTIDGGTW